MTSEPDNVRTLQDAPPTGQADIDGLRPWFHNLHLPDGRETSPHHALGDFPAFKWSQLARLLPEKMTGWTALDIGCNAGYYTIQLAARGATVRAIDADSHYLRQADWALRQFGFRDRVELELGSVYDLLHEVRTYDIVWFMGVLYHLRYPMLALDLVARVTGRLAVVQTLTSRAGDDASASDSPADLSFDDRVQLASPTWPSLAFIAGSFAGDATNWWVPNSSALRYMLRAAGLRILAAPEEGTCVCEPGPGGPDGTAREILAMLKQQRGRKDWR